MILLFWVAAFELQAQRHSYFFGHRDFAGVSTGVPVYGLIKNNTAGYPLNLGVNYNRILNSYLMTGMNLSYTKMAYNDRFSNDGKGHDYQVKYNDMPRVVTDGHGKISVNAITALAYLRKYNRQISFVPLGRFYGLNLGIVSTNVVVPIGYEYQFTQYYGSLQKSYTASSSNTNTFLKMVIGAEYGKTARIINDNTFLTVSASCLFMKKNRYSYDGNLNERFKHIGENTIADHLFFNLNIALTYGL